MVRVVALAALEILTCLAIWFISFVSALEASSLPCPGARVTNAAHGVRESRDEGISGDTTAAVLVTVTLVLGSFRMRSDTQG